MKQNLLDHLTFIRTFLPPQTDLADWLSDPDWTLLEGVDCADRESVGFSYGWMSGVANALNMTLLELLDGYEISLEESQS